MSYQVISEVGGFLRTLIEKGIAGSGDQAIEAIKVKLAHPKSAQDSLSLWLYSVVPNEQLRNAPHVRVKNGNNERTLYPPLSLNLYYLLTPMMQDDTVNHRLLGRSMQILHDSAVLPFPGSADSDPEELHLGVVQRSIQELAEVWEALQEPYRLSICYEVRVVRIPSARELSAAPVHDRTTDFEPAGAAV